ncbi:MAG: inorganic phosphate transporter, partial [Sporomusa sp.]
MPDFSLVYVVVFFALAFDYINGFHDTANAIATSVSTRALDPRFAVALAAVLNFVGALYSTGVAKTIGGDL